MRYKTFDLYIITLLVGVAIFSGHRVYFDNFTNQFDKGRTVVAIIGNELNTVKKKHQSFIAWLDASKGDQLSYQDQVFTYDNSNANLSFMDGTEINLGENTLFKIGKKDQQEINLDQGTIHARLSDSFSKIKLRLKDETFEINSTGAEIKISQSQGKSKITLLKGKVKITNLKKKKTRNLLKNQSYEYDKKTDKETIVHHPLNLSFPTAHYVKYITTNSQIEFQWEKNENFKSYELIVSKNPSLKKPIIKKKISTVKYLANNLSDGIYYWNVAGIQKKNPKIKDKGITRNFTLIKDIAPTLVYPHINQVFNLQKLQNQEEVMVIEWASKDVNQYQLEVATPDKKIKKVSTNSNRYLLTKYLDGNYQIRVKKLSADRPHSPWSSWRKFTIASSSLPLPPKLSYPKNSEELTFYQKKNADVRLKWIPVPEVLTYEVTISSDSKGEDVLLKQVVKDTSFTWQATTFGNIYWKVRSIDTYQRATNFSKISSVELNYYPINEKKLNKGTKFVLKRPDQKVDFEWAEDNVDGEYLFEVSRNKKFKKIIHKTQTSDNKVGIVFGKKGTYYWRTKKINKKGKAIYSKPFKIKVEPVPPLPKPLIEKLKMLEIKIKEVKVQRSLFQKLLNYIIPTAHADEFVKYVNIEWDENGESKSYILEVYKDKKRRKRIFRKELKDPWFEWRNPRPGKYYWRIAYKDHWNRLSPYSNLSTLLVNLPSKLKNLSSPQLITPKHNFTINKTRKKYLEFKWIGDNRTNDYIFQIATSLKFTDIIYEKELDDDYDITIKTRWLKNHKETYWRVKAKGPYEMKAKSKRRRLYVTSPPKKKKVYIDQRPVVFTPPRPRVRVLYGPGKLEHTSSSTNMDATIDGTDLSGIKIDGHLNYSKRFFVPFQLSRRAGTVFTDQSFSHINLNSGLGYHFSNSPLTLYPVTAKISLHNISSYKNAATRPSEESNSLIALEVSGGIFHRHRDNYQSNLSLTYGAGQLSVLSLNYQLDKLVNTYLFSIGVNYQSLSFESGEESTKIENDSKTLGLFLGVGKHF